MSYFRCNCVFGIESGDLYLDIVEFVEKVCGAKLMEYQKELIKSYADLPEGSTIVMGKHGPIIMDKDGRVICRVRNGGVAISR